MLITTLVLAGCRTLKNHPEGQENTTLKAVSDVQFVLRLAPYQSEDSSLYVFEVCQKGTMEQGCAMVFLSPSREPVVFTAQEIGEHRQSTMEAFAKLVRDNPGASSAAIIGTGAAVAGAGGVAANHVAYRMMPADPDSLPPLLLDPKPESAIAHLEKQGIETSDVQELVYKKFGKFEKEGGIYILHKSEKLTDLLAAQNTSSPHVFKQSFVDFLKSKYAAELAANNVTADDVLWIPRNYVAGGYRQPTIDWGWLIDQDHARFSLPSPSLKQAARSFRRDIFDDLIHPDALDDLKVLQNWRGRVKIPEQMLDNFLYDTMQLAGMARFTNSSDWNSGLIRISSSEYAFGHDQAIKHQLLGVERAQGKITQQIADNQGIRKKLISTAKKRTAAIVVIASVLTGGGVAHVLGVGQDPSEKSIDRRHPSLFEVGSEPSSVDSVQGIVVQLGEYLKASGADINYYCMPSGCQLLN